MANKDAHEENRKQAFTKDDAYQSLRITNTWISNIDTKISFALALAGVIIGIIFRTGVPTSLQRVGKVSKLSELFTDCKSQWKDV